MSMHMILIAVLSVCVGSESNTINTIVNMIRWWRENEISVSRDWITIFNQSINCFPFLRRPASSSIE